MLLPLGFFIVCPGLVLVDAAGPILVLGAGHVLDGWDPGLGLVGAEVVVQNINRKGENDG